MFIIKRYITSVIKMNPALPCLLLSILLMLLINSSEQKCTDRPGCFKKVLFNFDFPQMGVFPLKGTKDDITNYQIKAYGDFNNDLYTDFIATTKSGQTQIFVWNSDIKLFQKVFSMSILQNCMPQTIYLYDLNNDGVLDFTLWGTVIAEDNKDKNINKSIKSSDAASNCLLPLVRQVSQQSHYNYTHSTSLKPAPSSNPILISHKFQGNSDSIGLLLTKQNNRTFLKYRNIQNPVYESILWSDIMKSPLDYTKIPFDQPHWNIFMDYTGDCQPDFLLYSINNQFQLWVSQGKKFNLYRIIDQFKTQQLRAITVSDVNNDGSGDLILAFQYQIKILLNKQSLNTDSEFCDKNKRSFDLQKSIDIKVPTNKTIKQQSFHFGDIDINGYPDLLLILKDINDQSESLIVFENNFQSGNTFTPFQSPNYNGPLNDRLKGSTIISASFIDILENGILDIIVVTNKNDETQTIMFFNNYLCQNDYFLKGYGMMGNEQKGSVFPAISFYWTNSVSNDMKVNYQSQVIQTSYNSLQMPYTFSGLGRANNYIQDFTVGRNGVKQTWSPIIPNSQLAVYTTNGQSSAWLIKIFAFPIYELISVIIVTSTVLVIFGIVLAIINCKKLKKQNQPLMMQFMS